MLDSDPKGTHDIEEVVRLHQERRRIFLTGGLVLCLLALISAFFFLLKTVSIEYLDPKATATARLSVDRGLGFTQGNNTYYWTTVEIEVQADGFYPTTTTLDRSTTSVQQINLEPLPGKVTIEMDTSMSQELSEYTLSVDQDEHFDEIPDVIELTRGTHELRVLGPWFYDHTQEVEVTGYGEEQSVYFEPPTTGILAVTALPTNAQISVDGSFIATDEFRGDISVGRYEVQINLMGYIGQKHWVDINQNSVTDLGELVLQREPGTVHVESIPSAASVLVDGKFVGSTPTSLTTTENQMTITLRKPGYATLQTSIQVDPGQEITKSFTLHRTKYEVKVTSAPSAEVSLNQMDKGTTPQTLTVQVSDFVEVSLPGYATQSVVMREESSQEKTIHFELVELDEHIYNTAPATVILQQSIELKKFPPGKLSIQVPKSVTGEDAQAMRQFEITRPFYFGVYEIRRKEFALFDTTIAVEPSNAELPITNIPWLTAVKFCNWLSREEGFEAVYDISTDNDVHINLEADGFRLPTEAEWELVAQFDFDETTVIGPYPWGSVAKPPTGVGNLAGYETRNDFQGYLEEYIDRHTGLAPVGSYRISTNGIYDLVGNASEWVGDYYESPSTGLGQSLTDPTGPSNGLDRIVKGSNFRTKTVDGTLVNTRTTVGYKDETVGFRIARWIQ